MSDFTIFTNVDERDEIPLSGGAVAIVRRDIDFAAEERLTAALASIKIDASSGAAQISDVDMARSNIALVQAYLVAVRTPAGETVEVAEADVPKLSRRISDVLVRALNQRRKEAAEEGNA